MPVIVPPPRVADSYGSGHFGASRGSRKHNGQDYQCVKDSIVLSDVDGVVTKIGYPYRDHMEYRYIQVTAETGHELRYFYVEPYLSVDIGFDVKAGDEIGRVQDLELIYPDGMQNHIHFEVKKGGSFVDPIEYLRSIGVNANV